MKKQAYIIILASVLTLVSFHTLAGVGGNKKPPMLETRSVVVNDNSSAFLAWLYSWF